MGPGERWAWAGTRAGTRAGGDAGAASSLDTPPGPGPRSWVMAGPRPVPRVLAHLVAHLVALGIASAGVPAEAWAAARPAASVHVGALGVLGLAAPREQAQSQPGQSQRQAMPDDDDDEDELGEAPVVVAPPGEVEAPGERVIEVEVGPGEVVEIEVDGERRVIEGPPLQQAPTLRPTPSTAPRRAAPPVEPPPPVFEVARPRVESPVRKDMVSVRIASPTRMILEMRAGAGWRPLCGTPCSVEVPRDAELRVSPRDNRKDTPASRSFHVPDDRASVDLVVRPGSKQQRGGGVGLALLSAAGILTGAVMVEGAARYSPPGQRTYEGYIVVGLASLTFALGVGMAVTGRTRVVERRTKNRLALVPGGVAF